MEKYVGQRGALGKESLNVVQSINCQWLPMAVNFVFVSFYNWLFEVNEPPEKYYVSVVTKHLK